MTSQLTTKMFPLTKDPPQDKFCTSPERLYRKLGLTTPTSASINTPLTSLVHGLVPTHSTCQTAPDQSS